MKSSHEIEIKLQVASPRTLKRRLTEMGWAVVSARHLERNVLFDFEDARLRKARCLLRLRSEGGRYLLTFKGAPRPSRRYKVRPEVETEIHSAASLRSILEALGLQEVFRYEKYRTVYAPKAARRIASGGLVFYDETPIGNYLELEGSEPWIDRLALSLGFGPTDYITESYAALYQRYCRKRGIRPLNMIFRAGKS